MKRTPFAFAAIFVLMIIAAGNAQASVSWDLSGSYTVETFGIDTTYTHAMVIDVMNADGSFSGSGSYGSQVESGNWALWSIVGQVSGSTFTSTIHYDASNAWPGYNWYWNGNITSSGALEGHLFYAANDTQPNIGFHTVSGTANPVPIPGAAWLLGSSLLGLVGLGRRRQ